MTNHGEARAIKRLWHWAAADHGIFHHSSKRIVAPRPMPIIYLCMVVAYLIYLPWIVDGHTTGSQRVGFYPKDHSLQVTSHCQQINMTPQDPTIMPMLYKNVLLLVLPTVVTSVRELIKERCCSHYWLFFNCNNNNDVTHRPSAALAVPSSQNLAGNHRDHQQGHWHYCHHKKQATLRTRVHLHLTSPACTTLTSMFRNHTNRPALLSSHHILLQIQSQSLNDNPLTLLQSLARLQNRSISNSSCAA